MFSEQFFDLLLNFGDDWQVPRVKSSQGVKTANVPWSDNYERHTHLFERLTIDLLKATMNQTQTAKLLRCGFNVVSIIHGSVE